MNESNLQKLEEYLSSLECPVCHRRTRVKVMERPSGRYSLFVCDGLGQCCPEHWQNLQEILGKEAYAAENLGISYEPGRV